MKRRRGLVHLAGQFRPVLNEQPREIGVSDRRFRPAVPFPLDHHARPNACGTFAGPRDRKEHLLRFIPQQQLNVAAWSFLQLVESDPNDWEWLAQPEILRTRNILSRIQ